MSVKKLINDLEDCITDNYNSHYWLYGLYEKINDNERWHHDTYLELLFGSIKFDGISVNIIFNIIGNKYIELTVESDRILDNDIGENILYLDEMLIKYVDENNNKLSFYNYISSLKQVDTILRTYKFDKYTGRFINPLNVCPCNNHKLIKRKALSKITKNNTNIVTNCDACVVCYDFTTNLTCCKHVVCLFCLDKIAQNIDMKHPELSPTEQPIFCPMCRTDINANQSN